MSAPTVESNPYRLPRSVVPRHYDLRLEPDLDDATFVGSVTVDVDIADATAEIELNAIELDITSAVVDRSGDRISPVSIDLDEEFERAALSFAEPLAPGPAQLVIEFTGILNDKLRGFYRSTFTDDDGTEHTLATTQFESTNARRAFPCWDEPDLKATYDVTLVVPGDMLAVSCQSEISSTDLGDGRREVRYATTPLMSTYLLAFVVGHLEATDPVDVGGVPLRIVHRPGKGPDTAFALEAGAFALQWLTDYFGIPYPGDKLDMIAIPDFAFGAMENLGCVTYRELLLVVDPERTTQPEQQRSVDVIAHELAHMWFGDLVTMRWWEGLWLKEAFATFMEMLVTDAFRPEWNRWVDFGLSRTAAFDIDSLAATRPIEFEVVSPADAEGMYDLLTYEKGAAVVRMLEQYLGADEFRKGASLYLERHAFGNTETHDLWDALEESSGQPVRRMMDTWIYQGGYPVVGIERTGPTSLTLHQQRFEYTDSGGDAQWGVPVVMTLGTGADRATQRVLLESERLDVELDHEADYVLVNTEGSGFYRVNYLDRARDDVLGALNTLSAIERYGLVDDTWANLVSGQASVATFIDLVARYADETDGAVWRRIIGALGSLEHLAAEADRPALADATRQLLRPRFDELGAARRASDDDLTRELRGALLGALGTFGRDESIVGLAREIHADPEADASLIAAAVRIIAANGSRADFDDFLERFSTATSPQAERRYLNALSSFPDLAELETFLAMTLTDQVRTQDAPYVLGAAMSNRDHGTTAWRFIVDNWTTINERFPENSIARMLTSIRSLSHAENAEEIAAFLADNPVPQGSKQIDQHLERLAVNVELRKRVSAQLGAALA